MITCSCFNFEISRLQLLWDQDAVSPFNSCLHNCRS